MHDRPQNLKILEFPELITYVRERSPFYQKLYSDLPSNIEKVDILPLIDPKDFWKANQFPNNSLLTAPIKEMNGHVFKSGGTTGNPKYSLFTYHEWDLFCQNFGWGLSLANRKEDSPYANLFYSGDLYCSFLFIRDSFKFSGLNYFELPLAGNIINESVLDLFCQFEVQTLAGVPTSIMGLLESYHKNKERYGNLKIKKILYGGEPFFEHHRKRIQQILPNQVKIQSIGLASVDAGLLGYADQTCDHLEHRSFSHSCILEIIDDQGQVVVDKNIPGNVYLTNLTRSWMPVIRYPVGDRGMWVEDASTQLDRKFKLLGRSNFAARVGPVSIYPEDIDDLLKTIFSSGQSYDYQMLIESDQGKDRLKIYLTGDQSLVEAKFEEIEQKIYQRRPLYLECLQSGKLGPIELQWVDFDQMIVNKRTGKILRVIDQRSF